MNTYSQTKVNGVAMPFIMGCTKPSPIEALEGEEKVIYDPITQNTIINMRTIGTRCLKSHSTHFRPNKDHGNYSKSDKKNEIDDSKIVK